LILSISEAAGSCCATKRYLSGGFSPPPAWDRIESLNPVLNASITVTYEWCYGPGGAWPKTRFSRAASGAGPLHGIPVGFERPD